MKYYIGIDGGGTKTACALGDGEGKILAQHRAPGGSYKMHGHEGAVENLLCGIDVCLAEAGLTREDIAAVCVGVPCFGESAENDVIMKRLLKERLSPLPYYLVNDVQVGWAGSLGCQAGINLVAGTGSIAYGVDEKGGAMRCGGWGEFVGDEGSCYWMGKRTMELFSKQADGRLPRGPLYTIIREELGMETDFSFLDKVDELELTRRDKAAAFQIYAAKAAQAGDELARGLYRDAAKELSMLVDAIVRGLDFQSKPISVSYSGGLFHAGELILEPLAQLVAPMGCALATPKYEPLAGAVLLAKESLLAGQKS